MASEKNVRKRKSSLVRRNNRAPVSSAADKTSEPARKKVRVLELSDDTITAFLTFIAKWQHRRNKETPTKIMLRYNSDWKCPFRAENPAQYRHFESLITMYCRKRTDGSTMDFSPKSLTISITGRNAPLLVERIEDRHLLPGKKGDQQCEAIAERAKNLFKPLMKALEKPLEVSAPQSSSSSEEESASSDSDDSVGKSPSPTIIAAASETALFKFFAPKLASHSQAAEEKKQQLQNQHAALQQQIKELQKRSQKTQQQISTIDKNKKAVAELRTRLSDVAQDTLSFLKGDAPV